MLSIRGESPQRNGGLDRFISDNLLSGLINIYRVTAEEPDQLPRSGAVTAQAIIAYREENRSFCRKEDIKNSGIREKTYEKMRDKITV